MTPGTQYVLFLSVSRDPGGSDAGLLEGRCCDVYADGGTRWLNNAYDPEAWTTAWCCGFETNDLAFRAAFGSAPPAVAPANTDLPVISGRATVLRTLTATTGTWSGTDPISFGYQWNRCSPDTGCLDIPSATSSSYRVSRFDLGFSLDLRVIATNVAGSTSVTSAQTAVVPQKGR